MALRAAVTVVALSLLAARAGASGGAGAAARCQGGPQDHVFLQLQRSRHPSTPQASGGATTLIQPFDCLAHPEPMQVVRRDGVGVEIRLLNITSGEYTTLYTVPFNKTDPPLSGLNGCGINPTDGILYCAVRNWQTRVGTYLARLDADRLEFLAGMPWDYWSATFNENGTYHALGRRSLLTLPDVWTFPGFASWKDPALPRYSGADTVPWGANGADLVAVAANFEGDGLREYLVTVQRSTGGGSNSVTVARVSGTDFLSWRLEAVPPLATGPYGAGWGYQNRIFFANNLGNGIFEIDLATVNISAGHVAVQHVGPSVETNHNDGINCMSAVSPEFPESMRRTCMVWGDPHISVFDEDVAADPDQLNLQGVYSYGDYWLVRSQSVSIQARYWSSQANGQSQTRAIAVGGPFLGGNRTLIIEPLDGRMTWAGDEMLQEFPSEFSDGDGVISARYHGEAASLDAFRRHLDTRTVGIALPHDVNFTVNRWRDHIDVRITMRPLVGGQDGHCGNFNGDVSDDSMTQIMERMGGEVSADALLFPSRDFHFVGCFRDEGSDRDLPKSRGHNLGLHDCALACSGSNYFGRQWLHECWCGESYGRHGQLDVAECQCEADDIGGQRNCVYSYSSAVAQQPRNLTVAADCAPELRSLAELRCQQSAADQGVTATQGFLASCIFDVCFAGTEFAEEDAVSDREVLAR